jgi:aryl-alcohol dehydrogenase (NADP+)
MFDNFGMRFRTPLVQEAVDAYAKLANRRGLTLPQLALGYVRSRWYVGSTIIGATTLDQLAEDIDAAQIALDAQTLAEIAAIHQHFPNPAP